MSKHSSKDCPCPTSALVAGGLVGGFAVARYSGVRWLGAIPLAAAGIAAGKEWLDRKDPATAGLLGAAYLGAFGASHKLAKSIGAWPSVFVTAGAAAAAAHFLGDR